MMEVLCEALNIGIYAIACASSFILGVVGTLMVRARKPDAGLGLPADVDDEDIGLAPDKLFRETDDLCWPDGDHTPPEYHRKG